MRGRKGFSMVEMLVSIIIAGFGFVAASQLFDTFFALRAERLQVSTADVNQQLNMLSGAIRSGKVSAVNSDGFTLSTNYLSGGSNQNVVVKYDSANKRLLMGGTVLMKDVTAATFSYYDYKRAATTTPANIRTVKINVTHIVNTSNKQTKTRSIEAATKV